MKDPLVIALLAAFSSGMGTAVLGAINSSSSRIVGPLGTGLLVNILAGVVAAVTLLVIRSRLPDVEWTSIRAAAPLIAVSAVMGIATLTGVSFSLSRIGVAAGLGSIILGQMVLAVVLDAFGWNASGRIPLSLGRIVGLALLCLATWLLLPNAAGQ